MIKSYHRPISPAFFPASLRHAVMMFSLTLALPCAALEHSGSAKFQDCYASWHGSELTVGNDLFERKWLAQDGRLASETFRIKNPDTEWLAAPATSPKAEGTALEVVAESGQFGPVEAESLRLEVTVAGTTPRHLELKIFPGIAGVILRDENQESPGSTHAAIPQATGIENGGGNHSTPARATGSEDLPLAPQHLSLTQVTLMDQTDIHNELVSEKNWLLAPGESPFEISGNLLFLEDTLTGRGLILLKLAPLPHARLRDAAADFVITPSANQVSARAGNYPVVTLAYQGGRVGRIAALQEFQRQLRVPDFSRDGVFLSNTWGDRSRDARINEAFILKEIEAGQRLGVDVIQIDDGWQKGRSRNSAASGGVWGGWWAVDPQFWTPNLTRFPHGLEPVVAAARARGLKIGLWFSPDSSNNATNWQRDAEFILKTYHDLGIEYFKIDGMDTGRPLAAANERRLFDSVLQASTNRVVFDLDVTAGNRPGYFGLPEIGPIFVENRYTDWHTYWPHQTLRNLWELSQYLDPLRLRIEVLNNARNATNYENDPLAPARYRSDTLFAMAMTANPLGWFEISNLSSNQVAEMAPLVSLWKSERTRFHRGTLIPIGDAPDGVAWSGFASVAAGHTGGYLLLFRELNEHADHVIDLKPLFPTPVSATVLAGRGTVEQANDQLIVTIPNQLDYLWIRLDRR